MININYYFDNTAVLADFTSIKTIAQAEWIQLEHSYVFASYFGLQSITIL